MILNFFVILLFVHAVSAADPAIDFTLLKVGNPLSTEQFEDWKVLDWYDWKGEVITALTISGLGRLKRDVKDSGPGGVMEQSDNITAHDGRSAYLQCRAKTSVQTCMWYHQDPGLEHEPTLVSTLAASGPDMTVCDLAFSNVTESHIGWWSCSLLDRPDAATTRITQARRIFLQVLPNVEINFEAAPINRTFSIGSTAQLECKTNVVVQSCQWNFQQNGQTEPLVVMEGATKQGTDCSFPLSGVSYEQVGEWKCGVRFKTPTLTQTLLTSSFQQDGQTEPLVVMEGAPKQGTDCSFPLPGVSYEQVGEWQCGARVDESDPYTYTDTAYIQVEHKEEAFPIEFVMEPKDTEMQVGMPGSLSCKVLEEAHIEGCRWYWQPIGRSQFWSVLLREFPPIGNDCSLELPSVNSDMEGIWTCHVKPIHSSTFKISKPGIVTIRADVAVKVLTKELSIVEGEEMVLTCLVEEMVGSCKWKKRDFYESESSDSSMKYGKIIFPPWDNKSRDCSLRFKHAKKEHQGIWNCGIRFSDDEPFQYTLPSAVSVKLPKELRFDKDVNAKLAVENKPLLLPCVTLSAVQQCIWIWYEGQSQMSEGIVKFNSTHEPGVYNCSVVVPSVDRNLQGIWQCVVKYKNDNTISTVYAAPFSLTVVKPGDITFREVSPLVNGQPGPDGRVVLECVVRRPVEECLWLYQLNQNSEAKRVAKFEPQNFNNCSYTVEASRSSGTWTCGARNPGETNFTMGHPTTVAIVEQGVVVTKASLSPVTGDGVDLVCQLLDVSEIPVSCDWIHPSGFNVLDFNETEKYSVESHPKKQTCSVSFQPMVVDYGLWKCMFSRDNKSHIVGQASITVINPPQSVRLSFTVGVLAVIVLVLLVFLFFSVTYPLHCCRSNQTTAHLQQSAETRRYSEDPTKGINFSFNETPELLVDFAIPTQDSASHHYERVGRFLPSRGSFYQNVS